MSTKASGNKNISRRKGNLLLPKMSDINELLKRKKKLKKRKGDEWEIDTDSDYPVHEKYTKEGAWKDRVYVL